MRKIYKVIIAIIAVLLVVVIAAATWYFTTINCINIEHDPDEVIIGSGQKQALVIYEPSKHDTTKDMTMILAETLVDEGFTVTINFPSSKLTYSWEDYDIIAFGSPVYVGEVSPVLKDYVESNPIQGKNILIYVTGMEPADTKELPKMTSWVNADNSIVSIKIAKEDKEVFTSFVRESLEQWRNNQ